MTSTSISPYQDFKAALDASTKVVNIQIDSDTLQSLKDNGYQLCFAKKVDTAEYNVVWQSFNTQQYLANNKFSWTPVYQLFGSDTFDASVTVEVSTNVVDIGLGEESVLNNAGNLLAPSSGGPDISITMISEYNSIHPGLNQLSTSKNGQVSTPIYVAPLAAQPGTIALTPVDVVLVWFQQNISTSTVFSTSRSLSVEIDLTTTNEQTRLYKAGEWSTP